MRASSAPVFGVSLRRLLLRAIPICVLGASALHAEVKPAGKFEGWRAFVSEEGGSKLCFVRSEPAESKATKGKYSKRDPVAITVSHRPKDKVRNEISISPGYTYEPKSSVEIAVDGSKFVLYEEGNAAFAEDKLQQAIVNAMKKGTKLTVKGKSDRGTETLDTFSLKGAKAALQKIDKDCPAK